MMQRLRITYAVEGAMRYSSHLDQMRVWERALRRAAVPLAYSEGFNPRPRMQSAAALPVGFAAREEMLDLWLVRECDPAELRENLSPVLPVGLELVRIELVVLDVPALPALVEAAEYTAVAEFTGQASEVQRRVDELLGAGDLPRERRGRSYDLRPLVRSLDLDSHSGGRVVLRMVLLAQAGNTGRPEEVLDELGLADSFYHIQRLRLFLSPTPTSNL